MAGSEKHVLRTGCLFLRLSFPGCVVLVLLPALGMERPAFMLSLFSGCLALFSLYLMAVFLVWMVQGYPFAGPALLSLGCVLCGGSFSILCISLLRLRRNTKSTAVSDVSGHNTSEEVQHA